MMAGEIATFGALLRRLRQAAGLTQEELAERAGLSRRGINDLERGARLLPRKDTVTLLADALRLGGDDRSAFFATARRPIPVSGPSGSTAVSAISVAPADASEPADLVRFVLNASPVPEAPPAALPTAVPVQHARSAILAGTVTFLFTDIEGSTKLLQQLGAAYADALGEHQALLRAAFTAHEGVEVDTQGDAFFVAFASAPQAVAAAAAAARALAEHAWPDGTSLQVRVGLHTGTPQLVGDHYVGLDVHRAARIAAAGHGGQILLSQATHELVEQSLPPGVTLRDLGAHRLKDLLQPEHLYQLVLPNLPADFPLLKTLNTHQHNLPLQPTSMLGRENEVAAMAALLRRDDVRLVTLTGPGGIGKTRLAIQVAAELLDDFPDGVWFVRLSRLVDPALVLPTIAQTLGLKEASGQTLGQYLRDRQMLLVLDNFEQIVAAALEVNGLLEVAPRITVLVTSRVPLHLRGERDFAVAPLVLPKDPSHLPPPERLSQYGAVALFIQRAQEVKADFALTPANAPAIAEICMRLDGLPLALELAAARVKLLPPEALLARLSSRLQLLTGGARDLEEHQRTMRATIAWSEGLLTPDERALFRRLAVFTGGWSLDAAEAICVAPDGAMPLQVDLLDGLSGLADQSLLQQLGEGLEPRFGMLHVIREYALERLEHVQETAYDGRDASAEAVTGAVGATEAAVVRRAHAGYFAALAQESDVALVGPTQSDWLARLIREHDNLRAALGWAYMSDEWELGLHLATDLWHFWVRGGYLQEGRSWLERFLNPRLNSPEDPQRALSIASARLLAQALFVVGCIAIWQGDYEAATAYSEEAVRRSLASEDTLPAAYALNTLGTIALYDGDHEGAVARFTESLNLMRAVGDQWGMAVDAVDLGRAAELQGELERAVAYYEDSRRLYGQVGDVGAAAHSFVHLARVARRQGDLHRADALGRAGLTISWRAGDRSMVAEGLDGLAQTAVALVVAGDIAYGIRAARLLGATAALRKTLGAPDLSPEREAARAYRASARAALGEEAWAAAFAAGQALSLEEAIAEALEAESGRDDVRSLG
jgi:predicted ATPase/class 3 adenylate cyclase/transcriptional regulator with XRE-family HTH domain